MNDNQDIHDRQNQEDARLIARRAELAAQLTDLASTAVTAPAQLTLAEIQEIGWALLKSGKSLRHGADASNRTTFNASRTRALPVAVASPAACDARPKPGRPTGALLSQILGNASNAPAGSCLDPND